MEKSNGKLGFGDRSHLSSGGWWQLASQIVDKKQDPFLANESQDISNLKNTKFTFNKIFGYVRSQKPLRVGTVVQIYDGCSIIKKANAF